MEHLKINEFLSSMRNSLTKREATKLNLKSHLNSLLEEEEKG